MPQRRRRSARLRDCLIAPCVLMAHHFAHSEKKARVRVQRSSLPQTSRQALALRLRRVTGSEEGGGGRQIKTLRAVLALCRVWWWGGGCWGVKHSWGCGGSPLLMSAPTHSPDVSIHLERHSHTPPRDGASSVGPRLNYSSSSIPVRPSALPHAPASTTSVTLASVGRDRRQTKACWHSLTRSLRHENQQLRRGERSLRRTRIPDVPPNVLI